MNQPRLLAQTKQNVSRSLALLEVDPAPYERGQHKIARYESILDDLLVPYQR